MKITNFLTCLSFILLILLPACSTPEEKKEKHYLRAMEYVKIGDEKAAILELKNAIQLDPKFADARYQLGLLHLKDGNPQAAFAELQRAFSIDPKNADAGVKVAEFYLLANRKEQSRSYVEKVLEVNPDHPEGVALLANLELLEGNLQKAEEQIDKAIRLRADNDSFHSIRGRILSAQNKWEEGEKALQKAIELNPDSFAHYRTLLMHYEERKDEAATRRLLDIMMPRFPDDPQLYLLQAGLYQKKGEWEKAEQALLQAIERKKDAISYRLTLVDFYKTRRQFAKAEEYLRKALVDIPNGIQLQAVLAELLYDLEKFPEAKEIVDNILQSNPANAAAKLLQARFLIKEGKNEEALDILTPLTADYSQWGEPFYYAALIHLRTGKIELAQKAIEAATRNTPGNDRFHTLAGQIDLLRGQGIEAGKEAALALKINQKNFSAAKILVQALILQKEYDQAIQLVGSMDKKIVEDDTELLGSLGMAHLGRNDKEAALAAFTRLVLLAPDDTKALSVLTALKVGNDLDRAITLVQDHISAHKAGSHYLYLGELYLKNQQNDLALEAFAKAQELSPDDPQGYVLRARLLHLMGQADEAIAQYHKLLAGQPQSTPALMGLATTLESQGRTAEAMAAYQKILAFKPDFPPAANNLAWLLASQQGDLGEALRLAMQAKQALPNQPNIADTLGWVHYKRESFSLAISQFKYALEARPDDPTIGFHLALAQYASGEKNEAIALLQEILTKNKEFHERNEANETLQKWQNL